MILIFCLALAISAILISLFFFLGKSQKWDFSIFQSFECGYSSYFFSRFSYSVHYFLVALIFLFLDLEICVLMPFFTEVSGSPIVMSLGIFILFVLLGGLVEEWREDKVKWIF